jgi:hypothetical protein
LNFETVFEFQTKKMQAYTLELPVIFASADAPRSATLEYDNGCHGLKLTLHSLLPDGTWTAKTYSYVPNYVPFNEPLLSKVLADAPRAAQRHGEQGSGAVLFALQGL